MNAFEDREKGFEAKYRADQETRFKIIARRNRLLGEWAAGRMGLEGDTARDYARAVVDADFAEPGDADVVGKVLKDLEEHGVSATEGEVRKKMSELLAVAQDQIEGQRK